MTQPNITPQGFRTAAYLETKARMDAARSRSGKTLRKVTCTPPNVKCGGRCIPPNWDCRLKGKGADPALRAVRTDPVSGLANIERGVKRIAKGVRKGSFSEIEGGKRAIVRGVVKATPGDLQRKQELQAKLERKAGGIAAGLTIVALGLFGHNQLKRAPFYRDGVGRQIDDAVSAGINRVIDVTPGLRGARAERRAAGRSAAGAAVARATAEAARGPEAMRGAVLRTPTQLERRATEYGNAKVLENKIKALDIEAKELDMRPSTWRQKNLETFWGATRTNAGGAGDGSTFSEPATNAYLSRQFGFNLRNGDDATTVRRAVATALNREARNLQALARQERVNLKDADSRNAFLNKIVGPSTANFPDDVRDRAVSNLDKILGDSSRTKSTAVSRKELADTIYRDTRNGFDRYFGRIADEVRQPVGAALSSEARKAGYSELLTSARIGQSRYLAKSLNKPETVGTKMGQGLSDLIAKEYYSTKVVSSPTFTATDREIRLAASELSGRSFSTTTPALDYLRSNGFERLSTLRGSASRVRASTPSPEKPGRPARRRSKAQRIADAMRLKNEDGTPRYASPEAAEAAVERARKDELQQARIDAYLAVRADLRGKPCGASHIPKAHNCSKKGGEGRTVEQQKKRESVPQDKELKQLRMIEEEMDRERDGKKSLKGKQNATALAIGTVGAAALTAKALSDPAVRAKLANFGKSVTKSAKETGYKAQQEALSRSIDGLSNENIRKGIGKLPAPFKAQAYELVGKAKLGAASMSLNMAGYTPIKVDTEQNYASFKNKNGDIKSIGSVGDSLVSYTFHEVKGEAANILPKGRQSKHVVFQIDRKFDQKKGVSSDDTKKIRSMLTSMFRDSVSQVKDGTLLLNTAWDKDGKGSGREALYRRYGFNSVSGIDGMQWAVVENGAVKRVPKTSAMSTFMDILQS